MIREYIFSVETMLAVQLDLKEHRGASDEELEDIATAHAYTKLSNHIQMSGLITAIQLTVDETEDYGDAFECAEEDCHG